MKRQPLLDLIDRMKNKVDDQHFSMKSWLFATANGNTVIFHNEDDIPYCKTGGCLAGEIFLGLTTEERQYYLKLSNNVDCDDNVIELAAKTELGLNARESRALFYPMDAGYMANWTREDAIQVLEHIRDHQVIDWGRVVGKKTFMYNDPVLVTLK